MLAYVPFLNPMNWLHDWWYLLAVPLAFGISVTYRAIRLPSLEHFWRLSLYMTAQIVAAMIGLGIALIIGVQIVIPVFLS